MAKKKKLTKKERKARIEKAKKRIRRIRYTFISVIILIAILIFAYFIFFDRTDPYHTASQLKLIKGFEINVFADRFSSFDISFPGTDTGPRMMKVHDDILFVAVPRKGKVFALRDNNKDGVADVQSVFMRGLKKPHSIDTYNDWVYIAEEHQVIRVKWDPKSLKALPKTEEVIISDLPTGGHWTRTIAIHNNQLYLSIGSSCNNCIEEDVRRGTVLQCELDRDVCDPFAAGVRNAVGLEWEHDRLFATENGRDWLGDDFPPDEINILEKGNNYGWPYCHARNEPDPELGTEEFCDPLKLPVFDINAHSAPLGLTFYRGKSFPVEYTGDLFVAYHGSWNRKTPIGYKVVRIFVEDDHRGIRLLGVEDFVSGFRARNGDTFGRPVDIVNWIDGSLLITDDKAGAIYRVSYVGD
ncbi:PQQ-dependent sugar dehydrogenase [Nanoarchaeota archaeon]